MMTNDQKSYQPIRCDMIGVEGGLERFTKDGTTQLPPVASWRNNLTALSQHQSLFFIASGHCVTVYQPEFPYQTLHRTPALLIIPELANSHARGYLSGGRSGPAGNCINHLIVGELGSQEILLFATDNGNVEAYYVSSIAAAIARATEDPSPGNSSDVLGLRPFFSEWVCQSAWGLDIHPASRMIAVSSNTPSEHQPALNEDAAAKITVFAFALSTENSLPSSPNHSDDGHEQWTNWRSTSASCAPPRRNRNYRITLGGFTGHDYNIPNVQFAGPLDDEEGVWLLSTDISGKMKLWHVWRGVTMRTWNFDSPDGNARPWFQPGFQGWNVAALDVNSFRHTESNEEFIGARRAPQYHGFHGPGDSFNINANVLRIDEASTVHPSHPHPPDGEDRVENDKIVSHIQNEIEGLDDEDSSSSEDEDDLVMIATEQLRSDDDISYEVEHRESVEAANDRLLLFDQAIEYEIETDSETDSGNEEDTESGSSDSDNYIASPSSSRQNLRFTRQLSRLVTPLKFPDVPTPDIAIIHCSDSHIRLLGSPKQKYPHMFCADILRQMMPVNITNSRQGIEFVHMDRLNMLHKIPELGALLIATQTGRVALCALTKRPDKLLGFRIDAILPTRKQELQGRRPNLCSLVGMAIAPVQGQMASRPQTPDEDEFQDAVIDGVPTTFDPNMVVLRHRATSAERHAWNRKGEPPAVRQEPAPWTQREQPFTDTQAAQGLRRFRLMLTYSDLSVLTYEIWRDADAQGVVTRSV